jgi:hypothetical protein
MMKSLIYLVAILAVLINFSDKSYAIEFTTLADQSSYRCSGGIVAIGDLDRTVREKCGDPLEIGRRQDFGPIWIYHSPQRKFMYYLAFLNGKLQRIVGAPCSPDDPSCFDLR